MNSYSDQLEGFAELLEISGCEFHFNEHSFHGVINRKEPDARKFDITPDDENSVSVRVLKSDLPIELKTAGESFLDGNETRYRISRVHNAPDQVTYKLECTLYDA